MAIARLASSSSRRAKVIMSETTAEPAGEKFSKREFLAENGGKQPVSAEPSEERTANKNAPHRQPAPAAKMQSAVGNFRLGASP